MSTSHHLHEGNVVLDNDMHVIDTSDDNHVTGDNTYLDNNDMKSAYSTNDGTEDDVVVGDASTLTPWWRKKTSLVVMGLLFLVTVALAIAIPSTQNKKLQAAAAPPVNNDGTGGTGSATPFTFVPELPEEEIVSNKQAFNAVLLDYYKSKGLNWNVILEVGSPQAKALEWVAGSVTFVELDRARRVQRYSLGVFYYSTFQKPHDYWYADKKGAEVPGWTSATKWMSAANECEWEGIACEYDQAVIGIFLREHQLSGSLPYELAFLVGLKDIDLTSNFIYVNGEETLTPFTHLDNLETLEMEDNYVVTTESGLPPTLASMTSLQKIVLSYNILQGPLDGTIFSQLTKLTHLEVESNFIVGDFPAELLKSTSLIYIYIRRNLMSINLPTLLGLNTLPAIFALWLDSNVITGGIPTTISNHTDLASLSITNATLTGKIPEEMGNLAGLRRVWLYTNKLTGAVPASLANAKELEVFEVYENQLTGTMPGGVCQTISDSDYEFKELSADCEKIACQNCCTQCYP